MSMTLTMGVHMESHGRIHPCVALDRPWRRFCHFDTGPAVAFPVPESRRAKMTSATAKRGPDDPPRHPTFTASAPRAEDSSPTPSAPSRTKARRTK